MAAGLGLLISGFLFPKALKSVYLVWMTLAIMLGFVVSNVILIAFFFLVITPVGLIARSLGKDFLGLKISRSTPTYWVPREGGAKTPAEYEQQF